MPLYEEIETSVIYQSTRIRSQDRQSLTNAASQKCFLVEAHAWVLAGSVNAFIAAEREISGRCRHVGRGKLEAGSWHRDCEAARFLCDIWRRNIDSEGLHAEPKKEQHNASHIAIASHRIPIPPRSDRPAPPDPEATHRASSARVASQSHACQCQHLIIAAYAHQTARYPVSAIRAGVNTAHPRHATALPQSRDLRPARDLIRTAGRKRLSNQSNHSCQRIIHQSSSHPPGEVLGAQCLSLVLGQHHWTGNAWCTNWPAPPPKVLLLTCHWPSLPQRSAERAER